VADGLHDRVGDLAAVEGARAALRDQLVRAREVGVAKDGADIVRRPVRI
jgi:hypothetical protein